MGGNVINGTSFKRHGIFIFNKRVSNVKMENVFFKVCLAYNPRDVLDCGGLSERPCDEPSAFDTQ